MSTAHLNVTVNGEPRRVPHGTTVAALVESLAVGERGLAVALDRRVVPRSEWGSVEVPDGSDVEVVAAAAGG